MPSPELASRKGSSGNAEALGFTSTMRCLGGSVAIDVGVGTRNTGCGIGEPTGGDISNVSVETLGSSSELDKAGSDRSGEVEAEGP